MGAENTLASWSTGSGQEYLPATLTYSADAGLCGYEFLPESIGYPSETILALVIPPGVTATIPLVPAPDRVGPFPSRGIITRAMTGAEYDRMGHDDPFDPSASLRLTFCLDELAGPDPLDVAQVPNLANLVPKMALDLADEARAGLGSVGAGPGRGQAVERARGPAGLPGGGDAAAGVERGRLPRRRPRPRWRAGLGRGPVRSEALAPNMGPPVARDSSCAVVVHPIHTQRFSQVRLSGRGALDTLQFQLWESDLGPVGTFHRVSLDYDGFSFIYSQAYLGGLPFVSEDGLEHCEDHAGGCPSVATPTGGVLVGGRYYVLSVGQEPLTAVSNPHAFDCDPAEQLLDPPCTGGWPIAAPLVYQGPAITGGTMEVVGTVVDSSIASTAGTKDLQVLSLDASPMCAIQLVFSDEVRFEQLAVDVGFLAVRVSPNGQGVERRTILAGLPTITGASCPRACSRCARCLREGRCWPRRPPPGCCAGWRPTSRATRERFFEVATTPWPPPPVVEPALAVDSAGDVMRASLASFSGRHLAVAGQGSGRKEARIFELTGPTRGTFRRVPTPPAAVAMAMDGDDLWVWSSRPASAAD